MRSPIELLITSLTPDKCLVCGEWGLVVCVECSANFFYPDRCFYCKSPSNGGLTCPKCLKKSSVVQQVVITTLEADGKRLVYRTKYAPTRSGAHLMGKMLASRLPYLDSTCVVVVPIPTTSSRRRRRGFDQAVYMARSISRLTHFPVADVLVRTSNEHQIGLNRKERIVHMEHALRVTTPRAIVGKTALLVDDVVTTGATMEAAAKLLIDNGVSRVIATYFAKAV